jgi:hypothetical protein
MAYYLVHPLCKVMGDPFLALGPIEGHKVQHSLVTWGQIEKIFWISSLTPNVKPMGLISTFA